MVSEEKVKEVEALKELLKKYSLIAIFDIYKLPARQFHLIRKEFRGKGIMKVTKKNLLKIALEKAGLKELIEHIPQQPGIVVLDEEPFKFYKKISTLRFPTSAKEGDIAPHDITVKKGPTNLSPGPVISEFGKVGIPVGVEGGKVAIKKDVTIVKEGEKITAEIASILQKLGIEPMEVGLNVIVEYSNGKIYTKEILELVNTYPEKVREGFSNALNLSINICYPTKENIKYLLIKAFNVANGIKSIIGGGS